jgi:hAT family C-terminal dimerisation region
LGVVFDETTNVTNNRLVNIAITTGRGVFYYHNRILPPETASSGLLTNLVVDSLDIVSGGRRERINACSTDTCSVMRDIWRILPRRPGLTHCLMNPCDDHGLQLLISDILSYPAWSSTVNGADQIVRHFKHSPKQLAIFKDIQRKLLSSQNKAKPLIIAKVVRWGTHRKEFQSIIDNRSVFRAFAADSRTDLTSSDTARTIAKTITDSSFYATLEEVTMIIVPIHQAQIEAEGDDAHIGLVKNRWKRVMDHLAVCKSTTTADWSILYFKLEERYKKQVNDIHYLAHWLNPSNISTDRFYEYEQARVLAALESLIEPHQYPHTMETFLSYYNRIGPFRDTDNRWDYKDRPVIFWQLYIDTNRPLAVLATRMLKTIANSCPSERAFSAMKATYTITRNRLTPERVNKLLFIQINRRVLRRGNTSAEEVTDDESAQEVEFEDSPADFE